MSRVGRVSSNLPPPRLLTFSDDLANSLDFWFFGSNLETTFRPNFFIDNFLLGDLSRGTPETYSHDEVRTNVSVRVFGV